MDAKYSEYVNAINDVSNMEKDLADSRMILNKTKQYLKNNDINGEYGLTISSHALDQMAGRLEEIAREVPKAHEELLKCPTGESLLIKSNLTAFILAMISEARKSNSIKSKKSRSGGVEYHYSINIPKWSTDEKEMFLILIVENSVVKTGYFNQISKG